MLNTDHKISDITLTCYDFGPCLGSTQSVPSAANPGSRGLYVGLSYIPTFGGVSDFKVEEPYDHGTKALLPFLRGERATVLSTDNFDWRSVGTKITFGNSSKNAIAGSVGLVAFFVIITVHT